MIATEATFDTRFDMLVTFTQGRTITAGDHTWRPISPGVVAYTYRDKEPVELDIVKAAQAAGPIVEMRRRWGAD